MGIYDREYYREETPRGVQIGAPRTMVSTLVLINVALYLVAVLFTGDGQLMTMLAVRPLDLTTPLYWWRFVSYGFAHSPQLAMHIVGNMLILWFLGRAVEQKYGRWEFLRIYLMAMVLGSLFWAGRHYFSHQGDPAQLNQRVLLGASGAVTATVILFALNFPKQQVLFMLFIPMPAWALGVLFLVNDLFVLRQGGRVAVDVHLVGAAFAAVYFFGGWNFSRLKLPSAPRFSALWKRKPNLKVHDPEAYYQDLDAQADVLLEKVKRVGMDNLTRQEKKILEDYSRRMKQKLS